MTISRNLSFLAEGVSSTGVLGATYGGTGQSSITTGDLLYGSASNTISKLAIGSTGTVLRVVAGVPSWETDYVGTVTSVAATVPSFLSISGSPITTSGTLAITYSGTALPVANGGSGATTLTGYIYGNGTSAFTASTTIPTTALSGNILLSNGGGNAIVARYNSSFGRTGVFVSNGSGYSFLGGNLNYSSGNTFNYDITGVAWYMGDPLNSGYVSIGVGTGTTGTSAGVNDASTVRMTIGTSGTVGINTTPVTSTYLGINGGNVSPPSLGSGAGTFAILAGSSNYGLWMGTASSGNTWMQSTRNDASATAYDILLQPNGGNVVIGNTTAKLFASGGVSIGNTTDPGAGNLRFNTTGTNGIYFGSSSILTDYETGTWTPTPSGVTTLSGTPVWTGTYTKVGRLVTIIARMTGGNIAITNGGTSKITNLPYSATNDFWGSCGDDGAATTGGFVLTGGVILYFCTTASYTGGYFSASVTYTSS